LEQKSGVIATVFFALLISCDEGILSNSRNSADLNQARQDSAIPGDMVSGRDSSHDRNIFDTLDVMTKQDSLLDKNQTPYPDQLAHLDVDDPMLGCSTQKFGNAFIGFDLSNFPVGVSGYCGGVSEYSIRFLATHSGRITFIRIFLVTGPGYSGGTGGEINWQFYSNDPTTNHPTGSPIGSMSEMLHYTNGECGTDYACQHMTLNVDSPPTVTAGNYYHLYLSSQGTSAQDFYGVDEMWDHVSTGAGPGYALKDFNSLRKCNGIWESETWYIDGAPAWHVPTVEFRYEDGSSQGSGYMEGYHANPKNITSTVIARQIVKTDHDRCFRTMSFYTSKQSGNGLSARIADLQGNTIVEKSIDTTSSKSDYYEWYVFDFGQAIVFEAGKSYTVDISSPSGSFKVMPMRDGAEFGYTTPPLFSGPDTRAEISTNGGGSFEGWYAWGDGAGFNYGDLSLVFDTP
jgi:hypothetical protein